MKIFAFPLLMELLNTLQYLNVTMSMEASNYFYKGKTAQKAWNICRRGPHQEYQRKERRIKKICKTGDYI